MAGAVVMLMQFAHFSFNFTTVWKCNTVNSSNGSVICRHPGLDSRVADPAGHLDAQVGGSDPD